MATVNLSPRTRDNPRQRLRPSRARWVSTMVVASAVGAVVLATGPGHITFASSPRLTSGDPAGSELPGALAIQADGLHGDSVRISFVPPTFSPDSGVTYQYRLEGRDDEWRRLADDRSMTYPDMASGTYALAVHAVDARGRTPVANVTLTLVPPIWQSVWFLLSTGAVVLGTTGVAYRRRTRRLVELANVRTTIAMELHDDIGANLARVAVLSELVRRQRPPAAAVDAQLSAIARIARDSVTGMSDIVWAIDPERDRLVDVVRRMRQHAEDTTADSGIALTFDAAEAPGGAVVPMDVRRDVFLIFKEAVTNAARHSGCTRLTVTVRSTGRQLALDVVDDGTGFDPESAASGNGLANMRRRARNIGASLSVRSSRETGSTMHLELMLARHSRLWPTAVPPLGSTFAGDGARWAR